MPKSLDAITKTLYLTLTLAGALGCSKAPVLVSIDLDQLARAEKNAQMPLRPNPGAESLRASDTLPPAPKRSLLVGSGESEANLALKAAKENQERAYREALQDLTRSYKALAAAKGREANAQLLAKYRERFDALYDSLRADFEKHANDVGPLWNKLAYLSGFPDKGASKRLPPPANFIGRKEALEAIEVRKQIATLDAAYRKHVAAQIEDLRQQFRLENSNLQAQKILAEEAAKSNAEQEAKKIAETVLKGLEQSMIKEIEKLEALPGSSVTISSTAQLEPVPDYDTGPSWTASQRLLDRANLFARTKGYRLVAAGPGVRDVTSEFSTWQSRWNGR